MPKRIEDANFMANRFEGECNQKIEVKGATTENSNFRLFERIPALIEIILSSAGAFSVERLLT